MTQKAQPSKNEATATNSAQLAAKQTKQEGPPIPTTTQKSED